MTDSRLWRSGVAVVLLPLVLAAGFVAASARDLPDAAPFDLAPPPAAGTPGDIADRAALAGPFTADRIAQADRDRVLDPFLAFDTILGTDFERGALPDTERLLGKVQWAVARAILAAKGVFPRIRPYGEDEGVARCSTVLLRVDRSYPSGHAATGEAWATVLAALLPSHREALRARGIDYGQSRVVCGVHWPSDVTAGQAMGDEIAARILADPENARLIENAAAELRPFG